MAAESGQNPIAQLWYAVFLASRSRLRREHRVHSPGSGARPALPAGSPDRCPLLRLGRGVREGAGAAAGNAADGAAPSVDLRLVGTSIPGDGPLPGRIGRSTKGHGGRRQAAAFAPARRGGLWPAGPQAEAGTIVQELRELSTRQYVSPIYQAYVLGAMGELDEAFRMFDRAVEQRSGLLCVTECYPGKCRHAVRSDPRFAALLKKVGLEE